VPEQVRTAFKSIGTSTSPNTDGHVDPMLRRRIGVSAAGLNGDRCRMTAILWEEPMNAPLFDFWKNEALAGSDRYAE